LTPFSKGLPPAGTFLGEYSRLQRRIGLDRDLPNGTLTLWEKRGTKVGTGSIAQISDSGALWAIGVDLQCEYREAGTVLIDLKVITIHGVGDDCLE